MRALLALLTVASLPGQPSAENDFVNRIRAGGWFATPQWQRGPDGALEAFGRLARFGGEDGFAPILGPDLGAGMRTASVPALLAIALQGGGDLLAMTDAEFHLSALGLDISDVGLRQHLMQPINSARSLGRAELLDRMLIVDLLRRRRCTAATAELKGLLARVGVAEPLLARARAALADLEGTPLEPTRRRLAAATLLLPTQLDLAVLVDHARLPDMTGLTAIGRRLTALSYAPRVAAGADDESWMATAQLNCDRGAELPFGLAHRVGNLRLDHSCTGVTLRVGAQPPFLLCADAAGAFENEVWTRAEPIGGPTLVPQARFVVSADRLSAHTGSEPGKPSPAIAEMLLAPTDAAVRVVMPHGSRLAALAKAFGLALTSAELTVTFGERAARLRMSIATDSEDQAASWQDHAERLRRLGRDALATDLGKPFRDEPELAAACRAVLATEVKVEGTRVAATAVIPIMHASGWEALVFATGQKSRRRSDTAIRPRHRSPESTPAT